MMVNKQNNVLKPLIFAGLIIEGGIVSYDTNIVGAKVRGARVFGIERASKQYRTDQRWQLPRGVIAVQTGEVLMTVSPNKTIASYQIMTMSLDSLI